jgi:uncharacterized protein (DUF2225 family)
MSECPDSALLFKRERMRETDSFRIIMKAVSIAATCPYCGHEFEEDIGSFDPCGIWYGEETTECPECGREFRLVGPDPY